MYTLINYKRDYDDCVKSLALAKEILKQGILGEISAPSEVKKLRNKLIHLFTRPELSRICEKCKGDCCIAHNFHLTPFELFCFVIDNPDFVFPEPDWQFLEAELKRNKLLINNRCLFI